jgi:hypothetical protein
MGPDEDGGWTGEPRDCWTAVPGVDEVRRRLTAWARRRATVPDDLFDGDLAVRDVSVTTLVVTRLFAERAERREVATVPPVHLPTYTGDLEQVDVGWSGWGAHRWQGLRDGSLDPVTCGGCAGTGRVGCTYCQGRGTLFCWPRQTCRWCGGLGRTRRFLRAGALSPVCRHCLGSGQTACLRCYGTGVRPCQVCAGGWVRCQVCAGSGSQVEFTRGEISFTPSVEEIVHGDLRALGAGARRHYRTRLTATGPAAATGPGELPGLPAPIRRRLDAELAAGPAGQARARVDVLVLLAAEVAFRDGGEPATAYLLGEDWQVVVPDARRLARRIAWLRRGRPWQRLRLGRQRLRPGGGPVSAAEP